MSDLFSSHTFQMPSHHHSPEIQNLLILKHAKGKCLHPHQALCNLFVFVAQVLCYDFTHFFMELYLFPNNCNPVVFVVGRQWGGYKSDSIWPVCRQTQVIWTAKEKEKINHFIRFITQAPLHSVKIHLAVHKTLDFLHSFLQWKTHTDPSVVCWNFYFLSPASCSQSETSSVIRTTLTQVESISPHLELHVSQLYFNKR